MNGEALIKRRPSKGDIAFWVYDGYPFILSSPITEIIEQGDDGRWLVVTEGYGYSRFKAHFTMPKASGERAAESLAAIRQEERERVDEARRERTRRLRSTLGDLDLPINKFQESALRRLEEYENQQ